MHKRAYRTIISKLKKSSYNGIFGVFCIDSGTSGPTLGITVCTHGNEPCGLQVAQHLIDKKITLSKGRIIVVLNNIKAVESYLNAKSTDEERQSRFIDINMNRLPSDLDSNATAGLYEVKRAKELKPIWGLFDYALDIHSTSQPSSPMIIQGLGESDLLTSNFPIDIKINDIVEKQKGTPAIAHYGEKCISIGIEAGSHEDEKSQDIAIQCTQSLIEKLGMAKLGFDKEEQLKKQKIYHVEHPIFFPDSSYSLTRKFPMFSEISENEEIASNPNGHKINSPINGYAIFAPKHKKPASTEEEVMFVCSLK